jgi:hypothetical protein
VIPWDGGELLDVTDGKIDLYPGLAGWWRQANATWEANRGTNSLSLLDQFDYRHKLRGQLPAATTRVVYTKGGQYLAAARIDDPRVIIDHKL